MVGTIWAFTCRGIAVERTASDKYMKGSQENDEISKSKWWFEKRTLWYDGVAKGDGEAVDPLMEQLLGKKQPELVRVILTAVASYIRHQDYAKE